MSRFHRYPVLFLVFSCSPSPITDCFSLLLSEFLNIVVFRQFHRLSMFSSNIIQLLFTSLYSASNVCIGIRPFNFEFDVNNTCELSSVTKIIGRLLTNEVIVNYSALLLFMERVQWMFTFYECMMSDDQTSCPVLLVSSSYMLFTLLLDPQLFCAVA